MSYADTQFKAGGNAEASAYAAQENIGSTSIVNRGKDLGIANPDIASDEDFTAQQQNVGAGGFGGHGGQDNVYQNVKV
ncbi:MAG: hypothetical protein ACFCVA_02925 [Gammaproteobacteria bacterium]